MKNSATLLARVAILGANGNIGRSLAYQMKQNSLVRELSLYDIEEVGGMAMDLSHIPTPCRVVGYRSGCVEKSLEGAQLVLIPAGVPRKPGMTLDDLFNTNAVTVESLVTSVANVCPQAIIGILSNPLNSVVPVAAETLKRLSAYDPRKLFGVVSMDEARASTFLGEVSGRSPLDLNVPVIGGRSGQTIVPLFSQCGVQLSQDTIEYLTHRVRTAGDAVLKAKAGTGSASLSMSYATNKWATSVLRALNGEQGVVACAMVESPLVKKCAFFSSPVVLGTEGVEKIPALPTMSDYEQELLDRCLPDLEKNIAKGLDFASRWKERV